jgi:ABC-type multidrug transport system fused ATPase/permease subunit
LSAVRHADRILVFSNGKIVEEGTHQSLLDKNEVYADLVNFQLQ